MRKATTRLAISATAAALFGGAVLPHAALAEEPDNPTSTAVTTEPTEEKKTELDGSTTAPQADNDEGTVESGGDKQTDDPKNTTPPEDDKKTDESEDKTPPEGDKKSEEEKQGDATSEEGKKESDVSKDDKKTEKDGEEPWRPVWVPERATFEKPVWTWQDKNGDNLAYNIETCVFTKDGEKARAPETAPAPWCPLPEDDKKKDDATSEEGKKDGDKPWRPVWVPKHATFEKPVWTWQDKNGDNLAYNIETCVFTKDGEKARAPETAPAPWCPLPDEPPAEEPPVDEPPAGDKQNDPEPEKEKKPKTPPANGVLLPADLEAFLADRSYLPSPDFNGDGYVTPKEAQQYVGGMNWHINVNWRRGAYELSEEFSTKLRAFELWYYGKSSVILPSEMGVLPQDKGGAQPAGSAAPQQSAPQQQGAPRLANTGVSGVAATAGAGALALLLGAAALVLGRRRS